MPKTTKFTGVIENAYGKALTVPIKYAGEFEELLEGDEIPAKEQPEPKEILAFVNNRRKASARQASMNVALNAAGIEKPTLAEPEVQFKEMTKILVAAGRSQEQARQMANANLGTNF